MSLDSRFTKKRERHRKFLRSCTSAKVRITSIVHLSREWNTKMKILEGLIDWQLFLSLEWLQCNFFIWFESIWSNFPRVGFKHYCLLNLSFKKTKTSHKWAQTQAVSFTVEQLSPCQSLTCDRWCAIMNTLIHRVNEHIFTGLYGLQKCRKLGLWANNLIITKTLNSV